jgi:hypothetical protein
MALRPQEKQKARGFPRFGIFSICCVKGLGLKSRYWKMRANGWYWKEGGQDDGAVKEG